MSLILEALRKSEAERRRGDLPDLRAELPPPIPSRRSSLRRSLPWIAAVVALCIAVALLWHPWSRGTTTPEAAPVATAPAPSETVRLQPRPVIVARPAPAPTVESGKPPKPLPEAVVATPSPPPAATTTPEPEASATTTTPPPLVADAETPVNALPAELRKELPPLELSMHMWDPDPSRRFVILDGERHGEGDSVGPMRIRRIDADGVLFDWQGRALRLPLR